MILKIFIFSYIIFVFCSIGLFSYFLYVAFRSKFLNCCITIHCSFKIFLSASYLLCAFLAPYDLFSHYLIFHSCIFWYHVILLVINLMSYCAHLFHLTHLFLRILRYIIISCISSLSILSYNFFSGLFFVLMDILYWGSLAPIIFLSYQRGISYNTSIDLIYVFYVDRAIVQCFKGCITKEENIDYIMLLLRVD